MSMTACMRPVIRLCYQTILSDYSIRLYYQTILSDYSIRLYYQIIDKWHHYFDIRQGVKLPLVMYFTYTHDLYRQRVHALITCHVSIGFTLW
jgi:hypothetical protein